MPSYLREIARWPERNSNMPPEPPSRPSRWRQRNVELQDAWKDLWEVVPRVRSWPDSGGAWSDTDPMSRGVGLARENLRNQQRGAGSRSPIAAAAWWRIVPVGRRWFVDPGRKFATGNSRLETQAWTLAGYSHGSAQRKLTLRHSMPHPMCVSMS